MTIEQAKKQIINEIIEISDTEVEVTEDTLLVADMGMSSMQLLSMLGDLEDTFDVELKVSEMEEISTVGELCDYIIEQL